MTQPGPTLDGFSSWLLRRGRSESTASQYVYRLKRLQQDRDVFRALLDKSNSACYRNSLASALRAWAKYSQNKKLKERLEEIRLPALKRKSVRTPCDRDQWFALCEEIENAPYLEDPIRAVLQIISIRGLRCADTLRLWRSEIATAVKTGELRFVGKGERRLKYSAQMFQEPLKRLLPLFEGAELQVWDLVSPWAGDRPKAASKRIQVAVRRVGRKMGLAPGELFSHRFRHTYANQFLETTKGDPRSVFLLQDQMGWASLNTTRSYIAEGTQVELDTIEEKMFTDRLEKQKSSR